jgi:glycosyltransferase involved in cell wall biosynthesis
LNLPFVSVVLPTYNRGSSILQAVQSVVDQSYANFELIIVDDASSDNTEELILGIKDPRIIYIKNKGNLGANASRNVGIQVSKGTYIAFQDSDDVWCKDKLERQVTILQNSDEKVGVVYTGFHRYKNNSITYIPDKSIPMEDKTNNLYQFLMYKNIVSTQTMLVKKQCFEVAGVFDPKMPRLQDWELCIRLSKYYTFCLIDEPLVHVYFSKDSISSNNKAYIEAKCMILKKYYENYDKKELQRMIKDLILFSSENNMFEVGFNILNQYFDNTLISRDLMVECYEVMDGKRKKFKKNYEIMNKIMKLKYNQVSLTTYFIDHNINNVAIYGMGELGNILYHELHHSEVHIRYGIDNMLKSYKDLEIITVNDELPMVDAIIVSAIFDFENIKDKLNKKVDYKIISLEAILNSYEM